MKTTSLIQRMQSFHKSPFGYIGQSAADAVAPAAPASGGAGLSRRAGLRRRLVLYRIDELERQIEGEFGVDTLAPLLAELAALQAELR